MSQVSAVYFIFPSVPLGSHVIHHLALPAAGCSPGDCTCCAGGDTQVLLEHPKEKGKIGHDWTVSGVFCFQDG